MVARWQGLLICMATHVYWYLVRQGPRRTLSVTPRHDSVSKIQPCVVYPMIVDNIPPFPALKCRQHVGNCDADMRAPT